ncbi:MAG: MarR family transcriptional regulator [Marmoricola sp.]|nr:MarR family transcriptional regulator [Marmoricola sp.]
MASRSAQVDDLAEAFVSASRALLGIAIRSVEAADVPVTVPQHRVLVLLDTEGAMTVGEVASLLGVNQSNASRICDRLQKLGLVRRRRPAEDGRVVLVDLEAEGKRVVDAVTALRRTEVAKVLGEMSLERADAARAALEAFDDAARERDDERRLFAGT